MKFFSTKLIALLSVALIVNSAPAVSANIPAIAADFPGISPVYVNLLTTIPSLFLVVGVFVTTIVERKLGQRGTILFGLLIVSVFGTLPAWQHQNFWLIVASRCLLGFGIGLFNRLLIQMISQLFQSDQTKKAKALGLESACEGLGGIFMTLAVGQLLKINWTYSFWVYGAALFSLFCVLLFIPKQQNQADKNSASVQVTPISFTRKRKTLLLGFILFWIVLLFINYNLQITPLLIEQGIGDATAGSYMIAAIATGAFIAGNLFGFTFGRLNRWLLPLAAALAGLSILGSCFSTSLPTSLACSFILGFAFRNIMPYFMHIFTSGGEAVAKFGATVVLLAYNLGATAAPYASRMISSISGSLAAETQLLITGSLLCSLALLTLVLSYFMKPIE
ncbi:MFS transporter [Enterococcus sp. JM4C]|uniref:MFS transporter n=1 Tax=Candidatus Enterococcus huntleyi TaxID=1857217 RepID=UPI00137B763C|nr:MFS transporter [Enterococcus sp. JM4C]KAF1299253.1 MFS transporter [Enterococcus sp. JM4C]